MGSQVPHIATEQSRRYIHGCWPDMLVPFSPALLLAQDNNDINDTLAKVDVCFAREAIHKLGKA